jgi:F0F1-type ATP synthase membrane subunit b/b'
VENVERQDEREAEIKADVDELEQKGDELEERGEQLDQQIGETREEFERGRGSADVPGLQDEEPPTPTPEPRPEEDE